MYTVDKNVLLWRMKPAYKIYDAMYVASGYKFILFHDACGRMEGK